MSPRSVSLLLLGSMLTSTACAPDAPPAPPSSGIATEGMDLAIAPGTDFFSFVNGEWVRQTEIPGDRASWGSFHLLADRAEEQLRAIVEEAGSSDAPEGTNERKIGDLHASFMDEERIESLGTAPLRDLLERIAALSSHDELPALFAELRLAGVGGTPFGVGVGADPGNPDRYVAMISQGGLGLPNRDYYTEENFAALRDSYRTHVARMLALGEISDPEGAASRIFALEDRIARVQWRPVELRDAQRSYNPMSPEGLAALSDFPWTEWFSALGIEVGETVVARQPSYLEEVPAVIREAPIGVWREYLTFRTLSSYAPYLSSPFVEENFDFYRRTLSGVEEMLPRWKRGIAVVEGALGEALGQLYVSRHFPPESKARMEILVANLRTAFAERIRNVEWMGEETKTRALAKLDAFGHKIGYPDRWRDYSALEIRGDDLVGNLMRSTAFEWERQAERVGNQVDRDEWFMTPQTVNAYFSPLMNEIVFPAAILQPPFFDPEADDAVNYGAIGAVIGHELTHGFDDQGSRYDLDGSLRNWWTDEDRTAFEALADRLVEQYDAYCPVEGHCVQGRLTLGENIADLGGLVTAYDAWRLSLGEEDSPEIDGFTGDQRFFLGWAQAWRTKMREEALINQLRTDPHSPAVYRVNGVVVNIPEFHRAFRITQGAALWKSEEDRIRIW